MSRGDPPQKLPQGKPAYGGNTPWQEVFASPMVQHMSTLLLVVLVVWPGGGGDNYYKLFRKNL